MTNLDIIVPLKNEAPNIKPLVERISTALSKAKIAYRLILVDDRSTDDTVEQVNKLINNYPIILHKKRGKPGKAYCILEGAKLAQSENLAMLDADLQYPPEIIPQMLEKLAVHG